MAGHSESGRDIANRALGGNPIHEPGRPRSPKPDEQTCDADHNQQFEYGKPYIEALTHPLFIRCVRHRTASEKPGEKPENAPFAV